MTSPKSHKERDSRADELDRIAFERGLIEVAGGTGDGNGGSDPNSVVEKPEILKPAPVVNTNAGILIIDDDDQFRKMLRKMLKFAGYTNICEASNGQQGLELFAENHPDLIITDMVMPEKLGIDTIMEIRQDFPNAKIIAVSGGGSFDPEIELDMAASLGVRTFKKPFEHEEILEAIGELLSPAPWGRTSATHCNYSK